MYAVFDRPDDELIAVAGTPDSPLHITTSTGQPFYQDPQGAPLTAPFTQFLPGASGILQYDTFVTLGVKSDDLFSTLDNVSTTPGLAFERNQIETINGSWFIIPSGPGQGGIGAPNANGQVLFFQGSYPHPPGAHLIGSVLLQFTSNGATGQQAYVSFNTLLPAPGTGFVIAAGLLGTFRRRRRR
jgi:hypothetical protein